DDLHEEAREQSARSSDDHTAVLPDAIEPLERAWWVPLIQMDVVHASCWILLCVQELRAKDPDPFNSPISAESIVKLTHGLQPRRDQRSTRAIAFHRRSSVGACGSTAASL